MLVLGITGSIAAVKSLQVLRLLQEQGTDVTLVLTQDAEQFITPLLAQTFSKNPIYRATDFFNTANPMAHITLARQASHVAIVPTSAHFMAKLAHGFADCLLSAICLTAEPTTPRTLVPSMNHSMWTNVATQENVSILRQRGWNVLEVATGPLACGEWGPGRLPEPECIVAALLTESGMPPLLKGKKVVVTAGPTRAYVDPVRFLSNASSGKMGYAMAKVAQKMGAQTTLISGPVHLTPPPGVSFVPVTTGQNMLQAVQAQANMDIFVSVAAVCDLEPAVHHTTKQPKEAIQTMHFQLAPDILAHVSSWPKKPFIIGFCAQTENVEVNGRIKCLEKGSNIMLANDISKAIGLDESEGWLITPHSSIYLTRQPKEAMATHIFQHAIQSMHSA